MVTSWLGTPGTIKEAGFKPGGGEAVCIHIIYTHIQMYVCTYVHTPIQYTCTYCIYTHTNVFMYICIYTHTVYMYIHLCIHIYIYVYIKFMYIYIERERERVRDDDNHSHVGFRLLGALASRPSAASQRAALYQGLPFWLFRRGFKVSSGTAYLYRSSSGTGFDDSEIASPTAEVGIQKVDLCSGATVYTIGVVDSKNFGFYSFGPSRWSG